MTAFIIFHSSVTNPEKFADYAKAIPDTLKPFKGSVLTRGKTEKILTGEHHHSAIGILQFPALETAHAWYNSAAYQRLIPTRDAAATVTVVSYSEPAV